MAAENLVPGPVMAPAFESTADAAYVALVVWWDCHTIAVRCPLCSRIEEHDPIVSAGEVGWRPPVSLKAPCCSSNVSYGVIFPWSMGLGTKKNYAKRRFETTGFDLLSLAVRGIQRPFTLPIEALAVTSVGQDSSNGGATELVQDDQADNLQGEVTSSNLLDQGRNLRKSKRLQRICGEGSQQARINLGSMKHSQRFCPQITLDELKMLQSERTTTKIKILTQSAIVNGVHVGKIDLAIIEAKAPERRTVGILHEGDLCEPIIAVSGWEHDSMSGPKYLINSEKWTEKVQELCNDIGYDLESHNWDRDQEGRYHACHAEKQLITYFVEKHCLQRQNISKSEV